MTSYAEHRFHTLDGMRGIAAIVIMLYHYFLPSHLRWFRNANLAVDFFFVLSGFVVCHAYMDKLREGMPISDYIARRIGRLYPTAAASLLLSAPFLYAEAVSPPNYTERDFAVAIITNLAMLPNLTTNHAVSNTVFPSDPPLWSISFEMLASLFFPLLLKLNEKDMRSLCVGAFVLLASSALLRGFGRYIFFFDTNAGFSVDTFLAGFPRLFFAFPCGMLLYSYRLRASAAITQLPLALAKPWLLYAALAVTLLFPWYAKGMYDLFVVAIVAPLLVWTGSVAAPSGQFTLKASRFLGWLSYPLYCAHMIAVEALEFLHKEGKSNPLSGVPEPIIFIAAALLLAIILGLIVDQLRLQKRLANILGRAFAYVTSAEPTH